jgi:hypothetical protein
LPSATTHIIVVKINMDDIEMLQHKYNLYLFGRQTYNQNPKKRNIIITQTAAPNPVKVAFFLIHKGFEAIINPLIKPG